MDANQMDYKTQRKREYHRKWRAEHPESVRAAQLKYWTKKAAEIELRAAGDLENDSREDTHG